VFRIWILFAVMDIVLTIGALIVCATTEEHEVRVFPRLVWMLLILFVPLIGAVLWFCYGRGPHVPSRGAQWRPGSGFPENERPRQLAPDDDPVFLRRIAEQQKRVNDEDADMLRKWEEDLRRRERELRERSSE
jgi:hypothetical protein